MTKVASVEPNPSSSVAATAKTFHVVTLSGSVTCTWATPLSPTSTEGKKKAVGGSLLRAMWLRPSTDVEPCRIDGALTRWEPPSFPVS